MKSFILFKNAKIHYNDFGKGKAIVLLHGFLENSTMWNDFINEWSRQNRIITIDLLGHGKSECLGYVHSMELMAEAVAEVLSHLKIKQATLIGHSMGGYVALAFAELYPNSVNGLCLMNSTSKPDSKDKQKNRDRAIGAVKHNHKTFVRVSISNLFRPKNRRIFSEEIKGVKREALKISLQSIIASLEGMKIRKDRQRIFRDGNFKKMIIISIKDPVLEYQSLIDQVINTNIKVVELPDGHMSHIENKESFSYNIMHFIENI
jgi:pimeloyl-ACP methyl ester carboxylesterase